MLNSNAEPDPARFNKFSIFIENFKHNLRLIADGTVNFQKLEPPKLGGQRASITPVFNHPLIINNMDSRLFFFLLVLFSILCFTAGQQKEPDNFAIFVKENLKKNILMKIVFKFSSTFYSIGQPAGQTVHPYNRCSGMLPL